VHTEYGGPELLRLVDVAAPVPRDDEVLVRVRAVSLNASDWEKLRGSPAYARIGGLRRPRGHVLGSDVAGTVEAVGARVTAFRPGDDVFADVLGRNGGLAELVVVPQHALAPMPDGMTYVEAAAVPQAAAIALHGIRTRGGVRPGDRVLVNGAGGGAGTYAVQLAKLDGAEVTAVDNAEKLDLLRSLGADHVIDYRVQDYTRAGRTYDVILDLAGHHPVRDSARALAPHGRYLFVGGSVRALLQVLLLGPLTGVRARKKVRVLAVRLGVRQVAPLVELCRAGTVRTVVDRVYPLAEAPGALRRLGEGHALGKVVVEIPSAGRDVEG
jgi:NADPH:quinone reductase-like Zn-dependent oxidoreductase